MVEKYEECGECEGKGRIVGKVVDYPCLDCDGTGYVKLPPEEPGKLNPVREELHKSRHREH